MFPSMHSRMCKGRCALNLLTWSWMRRCYALPFEEYQNFWILAFALATFCNATYCDSHVLLPGMVYATDSHTFDQKHCKYKGKHWHEWLLWSNHTLFWIIAEHEQSNSNRFPHEKCFQNISSQFISSRLLQNPKRGMSANRVIWKLDQDLRRYLIVSNSS